MFLQVPALPVVNGGPNQRRLSGFLYGYTHDWDTPRSGKLGSLLAAKVIEKIGVDILDIDVEGVLRQVS